jgi:co-chaperonin GroES (HSP10)
MKKIIPRSKQVLVQPDMEESKESEFGIITPDNVEQEKKSIGTVLSVGKDIKDIKKGMRVIFGTFAGERIKFKESSKELDYILLLDEDVLAFIED